MRSIHIFRVRLLVQSNLKNSSSDLTDFFLSLRYAITKCREICRPRFARTRRAQWPSAAVAADISVVALCPLDQCAPDFVRPINVFGGFGGSPPMIIKSNSVSANWIPIKDLRT